MPVKDNKPVIFLAFANEQGDQQSSGYLRELPLEVRHLREILSQAERDGLCELLERTNATTQDIFSVFQDAEYRDRIAIFHYGGHANDYQLLLESADGQTHAADAGGLAAFFGQQKGLELVFLNGCSTQEQARGLLEANVSAVIATSRDIEDSVATQFAGHFYNGLTGGATLQVAFNEAESAVITNQGSDTQNLYRKIGAASSKDRHTDENPWHLYSESETSRDWNLPDTVQNPLFGLPELEKLGLFPDNPYQKPHGFREEDAEYFFGRGEEIRELYELVTDPESAPIVLFYGQAWVGKSSLLAAGLVPRLNHEHKILHCLLDSKKDLSGVFRAAFRAKDNTPLLASWIALEKECSQPVTVIIDQLEEVYLRRSKLKKEDLEKFLGELEKFLEDLVPVFEDASSRPQGKLILSIRKEWEADLRQRLKENGLGQKYREFFLQRLTRHGVVEAIQGLEKVDYLKNHYGLKIDPELPELIADDLLEDSESAVSLSLQILLTEMWRQAIEKQKADIDNQLVFDKNSYQELKKSALHLKDFIAEKLDELKAWNEELVTSGLVLDLLAEHISELNTADVLTNDELKEKYKHREDDILKLVEECKELGLLVDPRKDQEEDSNDSRLKHDALAPVVRALFEKSARPGQRARKILESRAAEWKNDRTGETLDKTDLRVVIAGEMGMRATQDHEDRLIEASRKEQNKQKVIWSFVSAVAVVGLLTALFFAEKSRNESIKADEEKARVHAARVISLAESQDDPLLSSLLILSLKGREEPAHGVRVALETVQKNIPLDIMRKHTDGVISVECNPHDQQVITASSDKSAMVWDLDSPYDVTKLLGHEGILYGASFSEFGDRYVTWTDKTVRLWESSDPASPALVGCHSDDIYSVAFRPDGQHLLTATASGRIRVWDANNQGELDSSEVDDCSVPMSGGSYYGRLIDSLEIEDSEETQDFEVMSVSYSPDGRYVVAALDDGRFVIWGLSGSHYRKLHTSGYHHGAAVEFAVFSHSGEYLVTVDNSGRGRMVLWQLDRQESPADSDSVITLAGPFELKGHSDDITGVKFSPDDEKILTISEDTTAILWYLEDKDNENPPFSAVTLTGHTDAVSSGEFSPAGDYVVTGSDDDTLRVWDLERISGNQLKVSSEFVGHTKDVTDVVFCPDNGTVVSASHDRQVRLWDVRGSTEPFLLSRQKSPALDARFSPDGIHIAAAFEESPAKIWQQDEATGEWSVPVEMGNKPVKSIDFSPEPKDKTVDSVPKLLTVRDVHDADTQGSQVEEWRAAGGNPKTLGGIKAYLRKAVYHPDGKQYVTTPSAETGLATVWDRTGMETPLSYHKKTAEKKDREDAIRHAEFNYDGSGLITATGGNAITSKWTDQKCRAANEQCRVANERCTVPGEECRVAVSACNKAVPGCSVTHEGLGNWLEMAVFSHAGQEVATASADGQVRLFSGDMKSEPKDYPSFMRPVNSIAFGPQDVRLLAASDLGEARIWNKDGSGETITLKADGKGMNSARFDPDGERVLTASTDGSVRVWRFKWGHLMDYLDASTRVCLTVEQRMRFLTEEHEVACGRYRECMDSEGKTAGNPDVCIAIN